MENKDVLFEELSALPIALGAYKASVIEAKAIETDTAFRDMCIANSCGVCGKCWMCPPDVGNIEDLMQQIQEYDYALVYQTVTALEDSFDFEGMVAAKRQMPRITLQLRKELDQKVKFSKVLHLGVGGCGVCEVCSKRTSEPCRFPHLAIPSLEAYGVNVSKLAATASMKYINGQNTVTYFGAVLFSL